MLEFGNGAVNTVDSTVNDFVGVIDSPSGESTTVVFNTGAQVLGSVNDTSLFGLDSSRIIVNDGVFAEDVILDYTATFEMYGGSVGDDLQAFGNATIDVYGGTIQDDIEVGGNSVVNLHGGVFNEDIEAFNRTTLNIFGGTFNGGSNPDTSAGISAQGQAVITIYGTAFQVDGQSVGLGELDSTGGTLSGTLLDGTELNIPFERVRQGRNGSRGTIVLVPEPSSAVLLGLGAAFMLKRSRRIQDHAARQ